MQPNTQGLQGAARNTDGSINMFNGQTIPVFTKDMIGEFEVDNPLYNADIGNDRYNTVYGLRPEYAKKYFNYDPNNGAGGVHNNYMWEKGADGNPRLLIKTGEGAKGAREIIFSVDANGNYVPTEVGDLQKWDTNDGAQNRALATLAAIAAGGALASGYFPPGAEGAAAAGGAPTTGLQGATAGASGGATTGQYSLAQGVGFNGMPYTSSLAVPSTIGESALLPAGMSTAGTAGLAAAGIPVSSGLGMVTPAAVNAAMNAGALVPTSLVNAAGGAPTTGLQGATAGASGGATTGQYSLAQGVGFNGMPYTSSLAVPSTIGESALLPAGMSTAGTAGLAAAGIPVSSGLGMVTPAAVNAAMNAGALVPTSLVNAAGLAGPATVPNQGGSVPSSPSPTGPRTPDIPGGAPGGSQTPGGSRSNLGNLLNILAGLYGADGARDYARDLKEQAARMRVEADPYLRRLQESYDNPNAYFESPEAKAMLGIEANRLTGIDSARGNLSNDIGRTKLLQDYGAARMNDYRTGLRGAISNIYKPEAVAQLYGAASRTENNQWAGLASALGNVTGGQGGVGNVGDWIKDIRGIVDGGKEVYDWIKSWF